MNCKAILRADGKDVGNMVGGSGVSCPSGGCCVCHGLPHAVSQASWQDLKPPLLSLDLHAALLISGLTHVC